MYYDKYLKYKKKYISSKNNLQKYGGSIDLRNNLIEKTNTTIFHTNLEKKTLSNKYYREVICTSKNMQLVIMSIPVGENISYEIHQDHDQFIRIEKGKGEAIIGEKEKIEHIKTYLLEDGDCIIIPANTHHEIINIGSEPLQLYTIYTPPEHDPSKIDKIKP
jgi:mannose-6-phosphate isomerase-like protein (cupin superfamily)